MFESTGWTLEKPETSESTIVRPPKSDSCQGSVVVVKQFQFSSQLQRMSVIAHSQNCDKLVVYTKGSPEMIVHLSRPETIPKNIFQVLRLYTEQGYRVIALGRALLPQGMRTHGLVREMVEKDLQFLGFVVFENRLKTRSKSVIKELRDANMKIVMITGDNILTAVSVAKECGILLPDEAVIDVSVHFEKETSKPSICFSAQTFSTSSFVSMIFLRRWNWVSLMECNVHWSIDLV